MATPNTTNVVLLVPPVDASFETDVRCVTQFEITAFVTATGDDNPIHINDQAAQALGFRRRIAHGKLVQSIAMDLIRRKEALEGYLPVLIEDTWKYKQVVYPGDPIFVKYTRKIKLGVTIIRAEICIVN